MALVVARRFLADCATWATAHFHRSVVSTVRVAGLGVVTEIVWRSTRPLTFVRIGSCDGVVHEPLQKRSG